VDFALQMPDLAPLPSVRKGNQPVPESLSIILTPAGQTPDAAQLFQTVYARFLSWETWSNPGGLIMRRFRSGTPYEDRELYIGAGGKRVFIALCPLEGHRDIEPCTTMLHDQGINIELRFNARHLPEWRGFTAALDDILEKIRHPQEP
jgi:hypothetical protein